MSLRLDAKELTKGYPGLSVLAGLDLSVAAGEAVAVRGASGTGKSTLLHLLGLLDAPDAGSIAIDGRTVSDLRGDARAAVRATSIGTIFQAFHLLGEFTARENVLMAARIARRPLAEAGTRADALLARFGLTGRADARVDVLSGGERQRLAVCRALLNTPAVVLADEPTGNLDPATAEVVLGELLAAARADGAAVVLVTHDPAVAARCDRRLDLRGGRLHPVD
jgi:ABC-type lipoprotein export system ATPase subunit